MSRLLRAAPAGRLSLRRARQSVWDGFVRAHIALFRLSGGRLGGSWKGASILLLNHVGRKSGRARTSPLLYLPDGDDMVIIASKGGSHRHPAWWLNLRESPRTTVEVDGRKVEVEAKQVSGREKRKLWPRIVEMWPDYELYQQRTSREIPVIRLKPSA